MVLHIYRATSWSGEARESAEMIPQWWPHPDIPYNKMWPDNQFWLHHVSILLSKKYSKNTFSGTRGTESSGILFIQ